MTASIAGGFPSKAREGRRASPFALFASTFATAAGRPLAFATACGVIVWAISGPIFGWSDTRRPVIDAGTAIVIFLVVFVVRNTQNRDGMAIRVKLDERIHATRDRVVGIEPRDTPTVERLEREIEASARATAPLQERNEGR